MGFAKKLAKDFTRENTISLKLNNGLILECITKPYIEDNTVLGRVWIFNDVTEQTKRINELEHQATHDSLTGLPNRALLIDRINQAIEKSKRSRAQFALMFLDLD